jgi:hypothetical protein
MAMDREGNFLVAWRLLDTRDVFARRYSPPAAPAPQVLANNQLVTGLSAATGTFRYFRITVPPGNTTVDVTISGGAGDADLYVRQGALPTLSRWDGRPYLWGNNESVRMRGFPAGDWYIGVHAYSSYSALSLRASSY